MDSLIKYARDLNKINNNNYFKKLPNSSLESFLLSKESFLDAIYEWSKYLSVVLIKLLNVSDKIILIKNIYDEYGEGQLNKCHVETFKHFYKTFDREITLENKDYPSYESVHKFINSLYEKINEDIPFVCGMLGMIEYTYITVSANIRTFIKKHKKDFPHYTIHEILDESHATDLFQIALNNKDMDKTKEGMKYGYNIMFQLYEDLSIFLEQ